MTSSCQKWEAADFSPIWILFFVQTFKCEIAVAKDRNIFQAPDNS